MDHDITSLRVPWEITAPFDFDQTYGNGPGTHFSMNLLLAASVAEAIAAAHVQLRAMEDQGCWWERGDGGCVAVANIYQLYS